MSHNSTALVIREEKALQKTDTSPRNRIDRDECLEFSARLVEAIEKAGTTQAELARHMGLSRSSINFWCKGEGYPSIPNVRIVAAFLRTTPEHLLYGAVKVPKERLSQSIPVMAKMDGKDTIITRMALPNEFLAHAGLRDATKLKAMPITEYVDNRLSRGDLIIVDATDREIGSKARHMMIDNGTQTTIGMVRKARRKDHVRITLGSDDFEIPMTKNLIVGKPVAALSAHHEF